MNEITITQTLNSREVAEMVGKEHSKLLRDIKTYSEYLAEAKIGLGDFFKESTYFDANNQQRPCFEITRKGCEFIANKLTGQKGTVFTAQYINRFHEMEEKIKPKSAMELLELEFKAIREVDSKIEAVDSKVDTVEKNFEEFKQELPLFNIDCEEVKNAKNKVVVRLLGGKDSLAYNDRSLRGRVYSDLNAMIVREFGVTSYKAIKRNCYNKIFDIIRDYKLPEFLRKQIENVNAQLVIE